MPELPEPRSGQHLRCRQNRALLQAPAMAGVSRAWYRKTVQGVKDMRAKDPISVYVCTKATGTPNMPLSIIGAAKDRRCFRLRQSSLEYWSQKSAWSDPKGFKLWWHEFLVCARDHARERPPFDGKPQRPNGPDRPDGASNGEGVTLRTAPASTSPRTRASSRRLSALQDKAAVGARGNNGIRQQGFSQGGSDGTGYDGFCGRVPAPCPGSG